MLTALLLALAGDPITAVVVGPDGAPIEGAAIVASVAGTEVGSARADETGFLSLPFPDNRALVLIEAEGLRSARFHAAAMTAKSSRNLGTVTLHPPGTLVGRIVDENGDRVPGQWVVSAVIREAAPIHSIHSNTARLDRDTGEFRFDNLPGGTLSLQAKSHHLGLGISRIEVDITPGCESFAELTYEGPPLDQVLRLEAKLPQLPDASPPLRGELVNANGERRRVLLLARRGNARRLYTDLGPGPYTFELQDDRYHKETFGPFEAGGIPSVRPVGLGTVNLELVDAATGLPRREAEVIWRYHTTALTLLKGRLDRVERLEGLLATKGTSLEVWHSGQILCTHELPVLTEEPLHVRIEVPEPSSLTAQVMNEGKPAPGVLAYVRWESGFHELSTDPMGRATFDQIPAGTHLLLLDFGPFLRTERTIKVEGATEVSVEAPPSGLVNFVVSPPEGRRLDELPGQLSLRVAEEKRRSGVSYVVNRPKTLLLDLGSPMLLPAGSVPIELVVTHQAGRQLVTRPIALPPVTVEEDGVTEHPIDLTGLAPAALDVVVLKKGSLVRDAELVRVESPRNSWALFSKLPGRCLISPGTYKLRVKYEDWSETFAVTLGSGEYFERTFQVKD